LLKTLLSSQILLFQTILAYNSGMKVIFMRHVKWIFGGWRAIVRRFGPNVVLLVSASCVSSSFRPVWHLLA